MALGLNVLDKLNPFSVAANVVETICDKILPKELEWVGDVASMAVNIKSGNWGGIAGDMADLAENVKNGDFHPDKLKENLHKVLPFWTPPWTRELVKWLTEPGAPPATRPVEGAGAPPPAKPADLDAQRAAEERASKGADSFAVKRPTTKTKKASDNEADARPAKSTAAKSTPAKKESSAAAGKTDKKPTAGAKSAAGLPASDKEFLEMVRSGDLPKDIGKDPAAMQTVQLRLQEIHQMNNLITNMLRAIHEMQMEIIRNTRA